MKTGALPWRVAQKANSKLPKSWKCVCKNDGVCGGMVSLAGLVFLTKISIKNTCTHVQEKYCMEVLYEQCEGGCSQETKVEHVQGGHELTQHLPCTQRGIVKGNEGGPIEMHGINVSQCRRIHGRIEDDFDADEHKHRGQQQHLTSSGQTEYLH